VLFCKINQRIWENWVLVSKKKRDRVPPEQRTIRDKEDINEIENKMFFPTCIDYFLFCFLRNLPGDS
jgi:hypothetical protein